MAILKDSTKRSYASKKFGTKKEAIEERNAASVKEKGGWFGLTHLSVEEHFTRFGNMLREKSPFIIIERDPTTFLSIEKKVKSLKDKRIKAIQGDLIASLLNNYSKTGYNTINGVAKYKVPLFRYGHLDFCCSAIALTEEHIESNLRRLASWWALKDTFYLDITLSPRADKGGNAMKILLNHIIPNTFKQVNWILDFNITTVYKDTSVMTNSIYTFKRKYPWGSRKNNYLDNSI